MSLITNILRSELISYINEGIDIDITKNMDSAPNMGSMYHQDIEAKGTYVTQGRSSLPNYINGKAQLKNPLFISVSIDTVVSYKLELSNKYKAKGTNLTKKLMSLGYDSIVTVFTNGEYNEIILFPNASFILN